MTDLPPDSESLIQERVESFRRDTLEHQATDPKGGIGFHFQPDDVIGKAAYFRMLDEDFESLITQNTDRSYSLEEIAEMKQQVQTAMRNFMEKGILPDNVL